MNIPYVMDNQGHVLSKILGGFLKECQLLGEVKSGN